MSARPHAAIISQHVLDQAAASVRYEQPGVPLYIKQEGHSSGIRHESLSHWHDGVELIHVLEGGMRCIINDDILDLQTGDFCFINRRQMHVADSGDHGDFRANIIVLDPALLTRNETVFNRFVAPVLNEDDFSHFHLSAANGTAAEPGQIVDEIAHLQLSKPPAYELSVIGLLHMMFQRVYLAYSDSIDNLEPLDPDATLQRRMATYIYEHFSEKITLDDIAASGNVSRSKCSRVFKRFLNKSPIDFLNLYRLEVASRLLRSTDERISAISLACGFSQQSYFNRLFGRAYGCTPKEYREQAIAAA